MQRAQPCPSCLVSRARVHCVAIALVSVTMWGSRDCLGQKSLLALWLHQLAGDGVLK